MKSNAMKMESFEDLFGSIPAQGNKIKEQIIEAPLEQLYEFKNHPFHVRNDKKMAETAESIQKYGILEPAIIRPRIEGGYEIVAGHRRKQGCKLAGLSTMTSILKDLTDDEATIIMVDSNIQREDISYSEKAFAYKMKSDAIKSQKRMRNITSKKEVSQVGTPKRTDEILAEQMGESRNQIQRYIRLTELMPDLLDMVDDRKISFIPAVELSYLTGNEQQLLLDFIQRKNVVPNLAQAKSLKESSQRGEINGTVIELILLQDKADTLKVSLNNKTLRQYFPVNSGKKEMEEVIVQLLDQWKQHKGNSEKDRNIPGQESIQTLDNGKYMPD